MKNIHLLTLNLTIIFISCQQTDSTISSVSEQAKIINKDSIYLEKSLQKAFDIIQSNPKQIKDTFELTYETETIVTEVDFGYIFSKKCKHLFVKRSAVFGVFYNIYAVENNDYELVFFQEYPSNTSTGDTIKDLNGDGLNDLLMYWYPVSGCCTAFMCDVALCQSDTNNFTTIYPFINVEFSPKDKIIRGSNYGYGTNLYKYQWNNFEVDTLETITNNVFDESSFLTQTTYLNGRQIERRIKSVPKEYHNLELEGE